MVLMELIEQLLEPTFIIIKYLHYEYYILNITKYLYSIV